MTNPVLSKNKRALTKRLIPTEAASDAQRVSRLDLKRAKANPTFTVERFNTPIGWTVLMTDAEGRLRVVDWEDCAPRTERLFRRHYGVNAIHLRRTDAKSPARRALEAYFEGELDAIDALPTATNGTDFQRAVWAGLRRIPCGQTLSYGGLAAEIGRPAASRAVGLANGSNPIAIFVPCHRVIGANGTLTGFGGGLERKRWLLAHENKSRDLLK